MGTPWTGGGSQRRMTCGGGTAIETNGQRWSGWSIGGVLAGAASLAAVVFFALRSHPHPSSAAVHTHTAPVTPVILLTILVVLGLAIVTRRYGRRSALALGLVALLAVVTAETALHSVHHLGDSHAEASCVITSASAHLSGVTTPSADLGEPSATFERADASLPAWPVPFQPIRAHEGRSPPVPVLA
jgi:hypothetical protein